MTSPDCSVATLMPILSPDRDVSAPKTRVIVSFLNVIPNSFRAGVASRTISAPGACRNLPRQSRARTFNEGATS